MSPGKRSVLLAYSQGINLEGYGAGKLQRMLAERKPGMQNQGLIKNKKGHAGEQYRHAPFHIYLTNFLYLLHWKHLENYKTYGLDPLIFIRGLGLVYLV